MAGKTVRVIARITGKIEKVQELKSLLLGLLEPTRREKGCIRYELLQSNSDPTDFNFVEEWTGDDAIDAHFETSHLQKVLSEIGPLLAKEPDIRRYSTMG